MQTREFYAHSGRFALQGILRAWIVGSLFGLTLASAYAYAILYVPLAGYVTFLITGGFGLFLGLSVGLPLKAGKMRNPTLAILVALPVVLGAFYVSWAVWVFAFLRRHGGDGVPLQALLLNPRGLWGFILKINEIGAWRLKGNTPTGAWLWTIWSVEALIIIGLGLMGAQTTLDQPFCENCEVWAEEEKDVVALQCTDKEAMLQQLEKDELDTAFRKLGPPADPTLNRCLMVTLHACPRCKELNTLTLESLEKVKDRRKDRIDRRSFLKYLLISRREAEACRHLAAHPSWATLKGFASV